jgi:AraC-like DNA-binding protein
MMAMVHVHDRHESMARIGDATAGRRADGRSEFINDLAVRLPGLTITAPRSRCAAGGWSAPHEDFRFGIALVRTGAWRRRVNGVEHFVDANTGYFRRPGELIEIAHFTDEAHAGTIIGVDPEVAIPAFAEVERASGPFVVTPNVDLAHRLLTSALRGAAVHDVEERTLTLISAAMSQRHPRFESHTRRATSTARRRLVVEVCEQLHRTPNTSLVELARGAHYSPFHLSRVFREVMGVTLSSYRTQLRVHEVLLDLEAGAPDLHRVAADAGFADHSHMTRTLVAVLGGTPSALRDRLRQTPPPPIEPAAGWAIEPWTSATDDPHLV